MLLQQTPRFYFISGIAIVCHQPAGLPDMKK